MPNYENLIKDHCEVMQRLNSMLPDISRAGEILSNCLESGGKILLCGNGGSAADSQHIAAEIVGRFETERRGLAAIALTTDTSILTAVGNDYGYDGIFSRQVEALATAGDVLMAYSTSGNSANVLRAVDAALSNSCKVIGLSGRGGGQLAASSSISLCVESDSTARIQEAHAFIGHALCAAIDEAFNLSNSSS